MLETVYARRFILAKVYSNTSDPIEGNISVPGDKSISHRAIMIGALAVGKTTIDGLLESEDIFATINAMKSLGADIVKNQNGSKNIWSLFGRGIGGLIEPTTIIDLGNSGTAARLITGIIASHNIKATLVGDPSLNSRPMGRVLTPLQNLGANFITSSDATMPITINGNNQLMPTETTLKVASAQVKSALLLAGLNTSGRTVVNEPYPSRDHTEKMLEYFGAEIHIENLSDGTKKISLTGQPELTGQNLAIPGDISSAAFPIVAALIIPGSDLTIEYVGINPLRTGILDNLKKMGGDIKIHNVRENAGEMIADIHIKYSRLTGITISKDQVPRMIDEYPILCIAASVANGPSRFEGIGELRVKESDRLSAMAEGLKACGVNTLIKNDSLTIEPENIIPRGGATIDARLDHRIAMSYLILGSITREPITIEGGETIETSFPKFIHLMNEIGANMERI